MEVTHIADFDTHAVIGGSKIRAFGMSDNAEFFTLLSDSLYPNKPLAVIREILCNAWDSHKKSGITDIAVKITVENNKLSIRDFGTGIHDKVIAPIYCVYGNSTKSNDGDQTGGFGLGSKAPFAYTNHFTVTSYHQGTKNVYAISRGSVETDGKPDLRTMVTVPTTESGIDVTIPLKNYNDAEIFIKIIKQITAFGEMNVILNGEVLPKISFSQAIDGVVMISPEEVEKLDFKYNYNIFVRYGDVIYPIENNSGYSSEISKIGISFHRQLVILQAEPNTIAVTPSRESLSYTERTIKTIKTLIEKFNSKINNQVLAEQAFADLVDLGVRYACDQSEHQRRKIIDQLMSYGNLTPVTVPLYKVTGGILLTVYDMLKYLTIVQNSGRCFGNLSAKAQRDHVLDSMRYHDVGYSRYYALLQNYLKSNKGHQFRAHEIWNRTQIRIMRKLLKEDKQYLRIFSNRYYDNWEVKSFEQVMTNLSQFFTITNFTVAHSQAGLAHAVAEYTTANGKDRDRSDFPSMLLPRKKGLAEKIIKTLRDAGFSVLDGTAYKVNKPKPELVTPRDKGYVKLAAVVDSINKHYNPGQLSNNGLDRIEEPMVVAYESTTDHERHIHQLHNKSMGPILTLVPDVVVVSSIKTAESIFKKVNDSKNLMEVLADKATEMLAAGDDLVKCLISRGHGTSGDVGHLLTIANHDSEVAQMIGGFSNPTPEIEAMATIYSWSPSYGGNYYGGFKRLHDSIRNAVHNSTILNDLHLLITSNPYLEAIDLDIIRYNIINQETTRANKQLEILKLALQG